MGQIDPMHTSQSMSQSASGGAPLCLILEPTRDLAEQTYKCMSTFRKYLQDPPVRVELFVGGVDDTKQTRALEEGVDIAVGTLQKMMDLFRRGKLDLSQIKFLVLDEADDLQKKDERGDIPKLNTEIKKGRRDRVQTLFFSATLHEEKVKKLIDEITTRPTWVDLKGKDAVPETVHHVVYYVDPEKGLPFEDSQIAVHAKNHEATYRWDGVHDKPTLSNYDKKFPEMLETSGKVKRLKPKMVAKIADALKMVQCLVFCRTNIDCDNLERYLNDLGGSKGYSGKVETGKENPYSCVVLAGGREQRARRQALEAFKEGEVRFLVCTDVAARGIDIAGLPFVIQTTLPDDIENYIHRIGRCGRAERMGLAVSIVATAKEKVWYHKCPTKGKNCTPKPGNTKLTIPFGKDGVLLDADEANLIVDEGGCTTWYDELDLLHKIEKRIGQPMQLMDEKDLSVPGLLDSPLGGKSKAEKVEENLGHRAKKRKTDTKQAVVYGSKLKDAVATKNAKLAHAMAPMALQLEALETKVQKLFALGIGESNAPAAIRADPNAPRCGPGTAAGQMKAATSQVAAPDPSPPQAGAETATSNAGWEKPKAGRKRKW